MKLDDIIKSDNVAEDLDEEQLTKIGNDAYEGYITDLSSREQWEKDLEKWTKLALQIVDEKTFPWKGASNVKYPLLSTAAMQFNARSYPTLVPSDNKIVKCRVIGSDLDGQKGERARRVGIHMSYQILDEIDNWEEEMDRLLLILPITGTAFKKTWFDSSKQKNASKLVYPTDLVVNYWAKTIEEAERKTEIIPMSKRILKERQLQGLYRNCKLPDPTITVQDEERQGRQGFLNPISDETTPYMLLEQHTFLDLDDDGYAEPYVVLLERESREVLRITPRFYQEDVTMNQKQQVVKIEPIEHYTKFSFVPNPDGGFYDIGFGRLLGSINASADTLVNQLIDSGTLNNMQAGFIGKGLRLKMGESPFTPGEWKAVNATGDDIKKQIFPLPTKEPAPVLMQLLQFLLQSGKELASVAEIFVGKMPGQNTPATTTMATIEQGMKVFTAVYKRVFRSLTKEYRKLYKLNQRYLDPNTYIDVIDEQIQQSDYAGKENDIIPAADPQATLPQEKQTKVQLLMQLLSLGTLDPMQVTKYALEAGEIPNADHFLIQQPPADPNAQAAQADQQAKQQDMQMKQQLAQTQAQAKIQLENTKANSAMASQEQKAQIDAAAAQQQLHFKALEATIQARASIAANQQDLQHKAVSHVLDTAIKADAHHQKMAQQAQQLKGKEPK
jgi:chaperonin GroES